MIFEDYKHMKKVFIFPFLFKLNTQFSFKLKLPINAVARTSFLLFD